MLKAFIGQFTKHTVTGWALDTGHPDAALAVSLYLDGQHAADIVADTARPDLAKLAGFGNGKHGLSFRFPAPLTAGRTHVAGLYATHTGTLLRERVLASERPLTPPHTDPMTPILVSGQGRTGTTLLMSLLANSPGITAAELLPYETRHLAYYATAHDVLTHPADRERSTDPDDLRGDGFHIGFNPYQSPEHEAAFTTPALARDFALAYLPSKLDAVFGDIVSEYYRRLKHDKAKPGARFFAEKNDNMNPTVRKFARRAFAEIREIVTIRDPRDVFCSSLAYFKGVASERAFHDVTYSSNAALELHASRDPDIFFCRYEKLLHTDDNLLSELANFLGTDIKPRPEEDRASMFEKHATSATPAATLQRWRTELPADMLARCNEAWAPFLETFGYPA